jgi:hypothetical protein
VHADTVVALIAAGLAAIIAVVVPWMTFRLALRQDQARWLREQRAQLYVDLLTEAHAEQEYLDYAMADDETRERMRQYWTDLRLAPLERARLGARGTIFGSRTVNVLFNRMQSEGAWAMLKPPKDEGERITVRVRVAGTMDELQTAIRSELGADRIPLESGPGTADRASAPPASPPPSGR